MLAIKSSWAKRAPKFGNRIQAVCVLLAVVAALGLFVSDDNFKDPIVRSVVIAIFGFLIIERIGLLVTAHLADKDRAEIDQHFRQLRHMIASSHDVTFYPSNSEGGRRCIQLSATATHVRNTVLRYGPSYSAIGDNETYEDWQIAKREVLKRGHTFEEIISASFEINDPARTLASWAKAQKRDYHAVTIDDKNIPMAQSTIFESPEGSCVVFGWFYDEVQEGLCFESRNPELVKYFTAYFKRHFENGIPI